MKILGIHDGHNSSVCLLRDGCIECAIQEERFTYEKNQGGMPSQALNYLSHRYGLDDVDCVVIAGSYMGQYDWSREAVLASYRNSTSSKNFIKQILRKLPPVYRSYKQAMNTKRWSIIEQHFPKEKVRFIDHHLCHASSAYYGMGVYDKPVLVITADGEGDGRSGSVYIGREGQLNELLSIPASASLGRLYSYITYLYNMVPYEHEYKIMGLAPYCTDKKRINECKSRLGKLINFDSEQALFWSYRGTNPSIQSAGREIEEIFHTTRFDVMAAAVQEFVEEIVVEWLGRVIRHTGIHTVAAAGGLFMNVKANMLLAKLPEVESIYVYPSCGDETNAIGAAYYTYFNAVAKPPQPLSGFYLGSELAIDEPSLMASCRHGWSVTRSNDVEKDIATLLAQGEIVGRVKGPSEFGARSLGNRAILANPSVDGVLRTINEMIKGRDFWMPFAPSVLAEDAANYFSLDESVADYEYMIFTAESIQGKRGYARNALHPYDYTGRPQLVRTAQNSDYHRLLNYYKELTGESLILNTSYNLHGYPMVNTQDQALHVFENSGLRYLALGNYMLEKQ